MSSQSKSIIREILQLSAVERATLVDTLIMSLDKPDAALDVEWLKEADSRMAAYRAGKLSAMDAEQVFSEMDGIG